MEPGLCLSLCNNEPEEFCLLYKFCSPVLSKPDDKDGLLREKVGDTSDEQLFDLDSPEIDIKD